MKVLKDSNNIEILKKLKLVDFDSANFDENRIYNEVDSTLFNKLIKKLTKNTNISEVEYNFPITEKIFFNIALLLLGYEFGIDYDESNVINFAKNLGLSPICNKVYSNSDFIENVLELLKAKTKRGIDFFEKLCLNEVFIDYNDNKKAPEILVFNGKTQPIFNYKDSIFEYVYVETLLDTDKDNKRDLIKVFIRRPKETNCGMKVPVIYIASPYMMGCNEDLYNLHNVDCDIEAFDETNVELKDIQYKHINEDIPEPRQVLGKTTANASLEVEFDAITDWYKYFVTRGYAIVLAGGIGTLDSEGVRFCGSTEETISTIAVIDWLNKRVKAFSNKSDNLEVLADWCNGSVGMTGKSYLGTLAVAAATTGVEGLKTIVPEAAISNWYEYYRINGLNVGGLSWQGDDADLLAQYCFSRMFDKEDYISVKDCFDKVLLDIKEKQDRITGNYNKFWDERNYLNNAHEIKASVFIVHGLRDWNVKSKQFDMLWTELKKNNVPRKMILHQGDHIYINNLKGIDFNDIMNRWYGYWLYDIDNDVMQTIPNVTIQNNADISCWNTSTDWPLEIAKNVKFYVDHNNSLTKFKNDCNEKMKFIDDLSLTGFDRKNPDETIWINSVAGESQIQKPYRLSFVTDILNNNIRISGKVKIKFNASLSENTGILSVMLVDYGLENRPSLKLKTVEKDYIIYGIGAGMENLVDFETDENPTKFDVITRGWMSVQNRRNNYNKDKIIVNKDYEFSFDMQPMDYTILKGHKLGLVIYSTDAQATQRPFKVTEFNVQKNSIVVTIPMLEE